MVEVIRYMSADVPIDSARSGRLRRLLLTGAKIGVMAGLLFLLYRNAELESFRQVMVNFRWGFLPLIYLLLFLNTALNSWKWGMLLEADGVRIPVRSLIASHLVGTFFNLFLPSSIGGDAYRIVDVSRRAGGGARSFASVFSERLMGFLALAIWGLLFSIIGFQGLSDKRIFFLPLLVFGLMLALLLLVVQRRLLEGMMRWLRIHHVAKLWQFTGKVLDSVAVYRGQPRLIARVFGISMLFQMIAITTIFMMSRALHWEVPFVYFCIAVPLITLGEAVPISIFGIGVRDSLYVFFFMQAGAAKEQALSLAVVYVLITLVYSLAGGLVFLLRGTPVTMSREEPHDA